MGELRITKVASIDALTEEALKTLWGQFSPSRQGLTRQGLRVFIKSEANNLLLAYIDNKIVGMVTVVIKVAIDHGSRAELKYLVVDTTYRRRGIGRQLVQEAVRVAKDHDASYIELFSGPTRSQAHSLYSSLGFHIHETHVFRLDLETSSK